MWSFASAIITVNIRPQTDIPRQQFDSDTSIMVAKTEQHPPTLAWKYDMSGIHKTNKAKTA